MSTTAATWKIRILSSGILLVAIILILKLYMVQVVHGEEYRTRGSSQYFGPSASDTFYRGSIFFQKNDKSLISAATLKSGYILFIKPGSIEDRDEVYEQLNTITPVDKELYSVRVAKTDDPYEEIATHVPADKAKLITDLKIPGVGLSPEQWRYYPGGSLASNAIGIIGYKENELAGRYGLERYYDDILKRNDSSLYNNFFADIFSNIKRTVDKESLAGDIVTTIDPTVQQGLESELKQILDDTGANFSAGIIMDPKTGAISALGVYPNFDLNKLSEVESIALFSNPIVEDVYEMGSIIKALTMAAGLDSGAVTSMTTYNDQGFLFIDGSRISNYDKRGRGVIPMQEVLNQSLNTGVAFVVSKMGKDVYRDYMYKFHIGDETGIDLPNEGHGLISNLESPRDIEYATASYGQGIALTPIATIRALSALGNGGTLPNPHIVERIQYDIGFSKDISFPDNPRVISEETSDEITRMLVEVVDKALLNGKVKNPHYRIAAKTGTAEIPNKKGGGYYENQFLHSFFGYFPAYDPKFIIFLMATNPRQRYASETLTLPFMRLVDQLINYYDIPPDR